MGDYKSTLNLPKTSFSMKANLPQKEPEILKKWKTTDMYESIRKAYAGKPKFILHDGPPYANGNIHMGHLLNKVLKDIVIKFKTMKGFDAPYVPGWDCHGLPIEYQLLKEMGKSKHEIDKILFRKKASEYAKKYVSIQRNEFKRLGIFGDWDEPYLTMNPEYASRIIHSFTELYSKGFELPPTYSGYSYYSKDSYPNPTDSLIREEILKFRDDAFIKYYNRKEWFDKIRNKFGQETVDIYKDLLKVKLVRK